MTLLLTLQLLLLERVSPDRERGATAVEYGLMLGLIGVAIIAVVTLLGDNMAAMFTMVATTV